MRLEAGQAVVEALRVEGVRHVFGLVGSSLIEVLDAMYGRPDLTFVGVRHEQVAAHMADGYARISGGPGVCVATNGPGATNLVTGVACARASHSPVIVITGAVMQAQGYRDAFQEVDQRALFAPITKLAIDVPRAERIPELIRHAFRVAMAGRKGPVLVNLPRDLLNETIEVEIAPAPEPTPGPAGAPEPVDRAARLLIAAARPVIVAGGGILWSRATDRLLAVADRLGAPVVTSYGHNDAVPADHPLVLGAVGRAGSSEAMQALKQADLILAAGTRLGHFTAFFDHRLVPKEAKIIQIEIDEAALGRYYPAEVGILGDVGAVLGQLVDALGPGEAPGPRERLAAVARLREARRHRIDQLGRTDAVPVKPQRVVWELRQLLPRDAIVVLDASAAAAPAYDMLDFFVPHSMLDSLDFGCVGCGLPLALGAKFVAPSRPVVCLAGDGGFLMTSQDLETAVRFRLPVVTVVLSNGCWGLEKAYQKFFFDGRYVGTEFGNPPFDAYARLFGAEGLRADRPDQIRPVLEKALTMDRPVVVEIPVDPDELPYPARTDALRTDRLTHQAPGSP